MNKFIYIPLCLSCFFILLFCMFNSFNISSYLLHTLGEFLFICLLVLLLLATIVLSKIEPK
jgi:hypothetical protein